MEEGDKIWVEQPDGSQRAGIFGGSVGAYVVYPDTKTGEQVAMVRVMPRDEGE